MTTQDCGIPEAHVPDSIGPFRVVRVIATGGMGTVYEATQERPSRTVAVKVMRAEMLRRETLHRFRSETDLLARLSHPGIAQVYQAGTYEFGGVEMPYFAMEFVPDARTLTEYAEDLDLRVKLELFAQVCDAVHFGHRRGVIHRDIKPENILISGNSDTPRPKVIDFGVARATDADVAAATMQTSVGQLVGTLHYMSPDQVEADPAKIDLRSDVYSLGVVLYELLTGRMPYDLGESHFLEVVRIIREQQPTRLSTSVRGLPGELETIAVKALEKDKQRRYQSAAALGGDVRAFLAGTPISARRPGTIYHVRTFARRNRAAFAALAAVFLVSIVAAVVSVRWAVRADSLAESERAARSRVERQLYSANLHSSAESVVGGRLDMARELLQSTPESLRGWEWRHLVGRLDESLGRPVPRDWHSPWVEFSPDGFWFYARDSRDPADLQAVIIDVRDGREVLRLHQTPGRCFFTPDQKQLITIRHDTGVRRYDIASGEVVRDVPMVRRFGHDCLATNYALERYSFHTADGVDVRDIYTDELIAHLPGWRFESEYSADGEVLMLSHLSTVSFFDARTHEELREPLDFGVREATALAAHPTERTLAVGLSNGEIRVHRIDDASDAVMATMDDLRAPIIVMAWSDDGSRLAAGAKDGNVVVFDSRTARPSARLPQYASWISELEFVPRSAELMCSDAHGCLQRWSTDLSAMDVLRDHASYVYALDVSPDGSQLVSGGWDGFELRRGGLKFRDALTSRPIAQYGAEEDVFLCVRFSVDGESVVTSVWNPRTLQGRLLVIDSLTQAERLVFEGHDGERVERIVPHPDGTGVLTIDTVGKALYWDLASGEVIARFDALDPLAAFGAGTGIAISPDGSTLAITRRTNEIWLIDARSFETLRSWRAHEQAIWSLAFTADGSRLLSSSEDDTIAEWDPATGTRTATLVGHGQDVLCVAPSPDGTRIASGGRDGYVRIWDTQHDEEVARLAGHDDYVYALAWAPDGSWLSSASGDHTVRVWDTTPLRERQARTREREALWRHLEPTVARALEDAGDPHAALESLGLTGRLGEVARQLVQHYAARFGDVESPRRWGPPLYDARFADVPPAIDGVLDDTAWETAAWTDRFVDIEGERRPMPALGTRAKLLWDDDYLYVGAELEDPHVHATLTERDSIVYLDNDFEIFLDPDRDALWYYELEVNALGTLFDLLLDRPYREGGHADLHWNAEGLRHAVHVRYSVNDPTDVDAGWSVELAIPWTVFAERSRVSLPPVPGEAWKLNFSRVQWPHEVEDGAYRKPKDGRESNWVWAPQHAVDMHLPRRWGLLNFVRE